MQIKTGTSSATTRELRMLSDRQRADLQLVEPLFLMWDAAVLVASVLVDDADGRSWQERVADCLEGLFGENAPYDFEDPESAFKKSADYLVSFKIEDLPPWLKNPNHEDKRAFLQRLLGAAVFDRLYKAVRQDLSVLAIGVRRAVRAWLPYSIALDDLAVALSPAQREALNPFGALAGLMLSTLLDFDKKLGGAMTDAFPTDLLPLRTDDAEPLDPADVIEFAEKLRDVSSSRTRELVEDLNAQFGRKMRGARTALDVSEDAASQAAASLIELLDRLLKLAFSDEEVMTWVDSNFSERTELWRAKRGVREPTTRGRALCFVFVGAPAQENNALNEFMAMGIVEVRRKLQDIKHNDTGTAEELQLVRDFLRSVEAFLQLTLRFAWMLAPEEALERIRGRIAEPAATR